MMNTAQLALYQRLQAFELDDDTDALTFSQHLARSNRWSIEHTHWVIEEYKKFVFLAVVCNHRVAPPDPIDQVWHLHILHSESYWNDFCAKLLQRPLHHLPARGGPHERATFHDDYRITLDSYYTFFGKPPETIWAHPERRFGKDLQMQRVNTTDFWMIPKPFHLQELLTQWKSLKRRSLSQSALIALLTLSIAGCSTIDPMRQFVNPNWILLTVAFLLAWNLREWLSIVPTAKLNIQLNHYEIAYLAGHRERAVDLALLNLVQNGYLQPKPDDCSFVRLKLSPQPDNSIEAKILALTNHTATFSQIRRSIALQTDFLSDRLRNNGLMLRSTQAFFCYFAPLCLVIATVIFCYFYDSRIDLLTGFLLFINLAFLVPPHQSQQGNQFLTRLRAEHSTAMTRRFALEGSSVLSGGVLDDLKQVLSPSNNTSDGGCGCGC